MSTTRAVSKSSAVHSPYQRLFMLPGAKAFCLSGAVARLPISMMSLGIVLALNHLYDNWTIAGTMSAAYVLAMSCVTPFYARAFDRFGQARVGRLALAVQIVAMLAFAFAALVRVPIPLLFALAIIMGLTQFSFGALVRTRWSYALRGVEDGEQLLNTAYAMEAAIDEIVFILGPILAAWLATSVHPVSQLFVPTVACGIGGTIFFSLKSTQPPVIVEQVSVAAHDDGSPAASEDADQLTLRQLKRSGAKPKSVLLYAGVLPLLAVFIVFNMSFTSFDVSITATMKSMGLEPFLGLQLAMFAVGSCIGALVFGSCQLKGSHWAHMVMFLSLLTVGYVFLAVTAFQLVFAKFNLAFNGNAVLFVYRLPCIDCVYSIIHIVAPFLKKETELLTALLYRQQPRKSTMALENLMPRLPHSAVCRHTCGIPHKAAVPAPGVLPLPAPA